MNIVSIRQHTFLGDYISAQSCVMDCGAHRGQFATSVSRKWHCKVYGLEPDPRFFKRLPKLSNCLFYQVALSNRKGVMRLNLGNSRCSSLYFKGKDFEGSFMVDTISLPEFCGLNNISKIDLLKMDIEGAEIDVLDQLDSRFLMDRIIQLTVEFHAKFDPGAKPSINRIIKKLKKNGFYYLPFSRTNDDVLFVNKNHIRLSFWNRLWVFYIKYQRGISRILQRALNMPASLFT